MSGVKAAGTAVKSILAICDHPGVLTDAPAPAVEDHCEPSRRVERLRMSGSLEQVMNELTISAPISWMD